MCVRVAKPEQAVVSRLNLTMNDFDRECIQGHRIRDIEPRHVGDLIKIGASVNLSPWTAENYLEELSNPNALMLLLVSDENQIFGFIVGRLIGTDSVGMDAEIYNVAINMTDQRKGYGQILIQSFVEKCRQLEVSTIWLEVRESNQKAILFYEKNGFERVQQRSHFYNNPREHAWLMRLALKSCHA